MKRTTLALALALALTTATVSAWGSKKVTLTIHSTPEGAFVTENGRVWGYAPIVLVYDVGPFRTCRATPPISVRWPSGAAASVDGVSLCPELGKQQTFTFERPTVAGPAPRPGVASWIAAALHELDRKPSIQFPVPGLPIDLEFAL